MLIFPGPRSGRVPFPTGVLTPFCLWKSARVLFCMIFKTLPRLACPCRIFSNDPLPNPSTNQHFPRLCLFLKVPLTWNPRVPSLPFPKRSANTLFHKSLSYTHWWKLPVSPRCEFAQRFIPSAALPSDPVIYNYYLGYGLPPLLVNRLLHEKDQIVATSVQPNPAMVPALESAWALEYNRPGLEAYFLHLLVPETWRSPLPV